MNTQLKDKVVVVTGAGQGIGRGIAHAFASEGAHVVVADMNETSCVNVAREVEGLGVRALPMRCDVSSKDDVAALFAKAVETFGHVDVLVNNAGIFPFLSLEAMEEGDWQKVMDVNMKGVYLTAREAAKVLPEGGRIVNISSVASVIGFEGLTHYCASKAGVNGFTRALALELAKKKITVNAVAPGAIATPGAGGAQSDEVLKQTLAMIPLARQGQPEDIAAATVFLASEGASYITGQSLIVDGGWVLR
jgi:3-oxoacyl-[acyl-carrier protein] reductase